MEKHQMKSTYWKCILLICTMVSLFLNGMVYSLAEEIAYDEMNEIMIAANSISAKAEPQESADIIIEYEKDAPVFVIGITADNWYVVRYKDQVGYVRQEELQPRVIDTEAWNQEFGELAQEGEELIMQVERSREESRPSYIWGSILIILVMAIFGVGIITAWKNKDKDD